MSNDPYTPPTAPIEDVVPETGQPWHMIAVIGFLALKGLLELIGVLSVLIKPALAGFGLVSSYLLLLNSVLILTAAYMMFRRSRHAFIPLVLVLVRFYLIVPLLTQRPISPPSQQYGASYFSQLVAYFSQFPLPLNLSMLFLLACTAYCLWLRKRGMLV